MLESNKKYGFLNAAGTGAFTAAQVSQTSLGKQSSGNSDIIQGDTTVVPTENIFRDEQSRPKEEAKAKGDPMGIIVIGVIVIGLGTLAYFKFRK